jgi:hypothetical protein
MSAEEVSQGNPWGLLETPDTGRVVSTSMVNMCPVNQDTRHHWVSLGIGAQSCEVLKCDGCGEVLYD